MTQHMEGAGSIIVLNDAVTGRQIYPRLPHQERTVPALPESVGAELKEREELVRLILEAGNEARIALEEHKGQTIRPNANNRGQLVDFASLPEEVSVREGVVDQVLGFYDWTLQSPELRAAGLAPTKIIDQGSTKPSEGADGRLHSMHTTYYGLGPDNAVAVGVTVYRSESPNGDYARLPLSTTPRPVFPTEVGVWVHYPAAEMMDGLTSHKAAA